MVLEVLFELPLDQDEVTAAEEHAVEIVVVVGMQPGGGAPAAHPQFCLLEVLAQSSTTDALGQLQEIDESK